MREWSSAQPRSGWPPLGDSRVSMLGVSNDGAADESDGAAVAPESDGAGVVASDSAVGSGAGAVTGSDVADSAAALSSFLPSSAVLVGVDAFSSASVAVGCSVVAGVVACSSGAGATRGR